MTRTVQVTRYVTPLREGGSLPAIVEGDDDGTYVLKFRGAGQGPKALIAELLSGEIARALGLRVPEIVFMQLDALLGRSEPDYEIRSLIKASDGLNLALDYLPGSITFDPLLPKPITQQPELASQIVWFDAFVTNIDRTPRNTNLLVWHHELWLIDHGATLFFHHSGEAYAERADSVFPQIKDHVLLPFADKLAEVDMLFAARLTPDILTDIVAIIPEEWLDSEVFGSTQAHRDAYVTYFLKRLEAPRAFVQEANDAHLHL